MNLKEYILRNYIICRTTDGAWKVLVDGGKIQFQGHTASYTHRPIRGNGEMVIGQYNIITIAVTRYCINNGLE